ncbi:hypothetical protein [Gryllotalpicola koreensis]|uniref:Uncharacterized protein n=1 Tax=Gryllotalpicola koreensis TaxID=993086 RepID=A0ABP8A360_9MICO
MYEDATVRIRLKQRSNDPRADLRRTLNLATLPSDDLSLLPGIVPATVTITIEADDQFGDGRNFAIDLWDPQDRAEVYAQRLADDLKRADPQTIPEVLTA